MPDNKDLRNERDRNRVAANEDYELDYLVDKMGVTRDQIQDAIKAVGNDRQKVEEHLRNTRTR